MNWINVPYGSNQVYIVQEEAITSALNLILNEEKEVKLVDKKLNLLFNQDHSNLEIVLQIKVKKNTKKSAAEIIKKLVSNVENALIALIDTKPLNVQVIFSGLY
ncbi:MMB_0454 family protein [Mycoplasmopsis glycophila]|uniref:Uncharacterized protein n=1 Tax=Mycoplasmopsis glycophila TaxID=171285 RepID=A0A449AW48_9BACT|nr:hypothetical protein [Mycoplasmopsis glycophila]VEU70885.1 Uncharacterised protein [Mycoplasmopsis glycophila]